MEMVNQVKNSNAPRRAALVAGLLAVGASMQTFAAITLTEVETAIEGATTSGETVGGYIIGAVAALAVVGVIIALVRKI